jgi:hypothetical protein
MEILEQIAAMAKEEKVSKTDTLTKKIVVTGQDAEALKRFVNGKVVIKQQTTILGASACKALPGLARDDLAMEFHGVSRAPGRYLLTTEDGAYEAKVDIRTKGYAPRGLDQERYDAIAKAIGVDPRLDALGAEHPDSVKGREFMDRHLRKEVSVNVDMTKVPKEQHQTVLEAITPLMQTLPAGAITTPSVYMVKDSFHDGKRMELSLVQVLGLEQELPISTAIKL